MTRKYITILLCVMAAGPLLTYCAPTQHMSRVCSADSCSSSTSSLSPNSQYSSNGSEDGDSSELPYLGDWEIVNLQIARRVGNQQQQQQQSNEHGRSSSDPVSRSKSNNSNLSVNEATRLGGGVASRHSGAFSDISNVNRRRFSGSSLASSSMDSVDPQALFKRMREDFGINIDDLSDSEHCAHGHEPLQQSQLQRQSNLMLSKQTESPEEDDEQPKNYFEPSKHSQRSSLSSIRSTKTNRDSSESSHASLQANHFADNLVSSPLSTRAYLGSVGTQRRQPLFVAISDDDDSSYNSSSSDDESSFGCPEGLYPQGENSLGSLMVSPNSNTPDTSGELRTPTRYSGLNPHFRFPIRTKDADYSDNDETPRQRDFSKFSSRPTSPRTPGFSSPPLSPSGSTAALPPVSSGILFKPILAQPSPRRIVQPKVLEEAASNAESSDRVHRAAHLEAEEPAWFKDIERDFNEVIKTLDKESD